jgi:hypothetical protein
MVQAMGVLGVCFTMGVRGVYVDAGDHWLVTLTQTRLQMTYIGERDRIWEYNKEGVW